MKDFLLPPADRMGTVVLIGHMDVPARQYAQVSAALEWHKKLTREEPGCIIFNVDPCPDVKHRLLVSEKFIDQAAFDAHQTRAGASPWAEVTRGIPREYKIKVVE